LGGEFVGFEVDGGQMGLHGRPRGRFVLRRDGSEDRLVLGESTLRAVARVQHAQGLVLMEVAQVGD
jgi:hypothetical protein